MQQRRHTSRRGDGQDFRRLLLVITSLAYGGAETQAKELAIRLAGRGWQILIVSMLAPQAYVTELLDAGIQVVSLNMRRGVPDPRAALWLARVVRMWRPAIVHGHMVHANLLVRLARPLAQVPVVVCTAHSVDEGGWQRTLAYRVTDFLCDMTTQVSRAGVKRYVEIGAVPSHKIRFVPNGVETSRFRPDSGVRAALRSELNLGDRFTWLAVGRLETAKDYPSMLRAFANVAKERPDAFLLIAGQGPLRTAAARLASDLGLSDRVRFLGLRRDVPSLMNAADAYVMSSAWEGMPMVLLEAAATGLPVVATDVGGNKEVVVHGKSGFLVPPRDPVALAQFMLRLMELSPEQRTRMGRAARVHVEENYSMERVVDLWEALYVELLEQKDSSGSEGALSCVRA